VQVPSHGPIVLGLLLLLAAGCAISEHDNRRTLNALDLHLSPESAATRWMVAPLALPVGVAGLAVDAAVVHPCCVFDDAWGDTTEWLWTSHGESRFRRAVMVPLSALATPFLFAGDWLARALFDIDPRLEDA
jgi:hypothetical protein